MNYLSWQRIERLLNSKCRTERQTDRKVWLRHFLSFSRLCLTTLFSTRQIVPLSLSVSLFLSLSFSLSLSVSLFQSLSFCLSLSLFLFLYVSIFSFISPLSFNFLFFFYLLCFHLLSAVILQIAPENSFSLATVSNNDNDLFSPIRFVT